MGVGVQNPASTQNLAPQEPNHFSDGAHMRSYTSLNSAQKLQQLTMSSIGNPKPQLKKVASPKVANPFTGQQPKAKTLQVKPTQQMNDSAGDIADECDSYQ